LSTFARFWPFAFGVGENLRTLVAVRSVVRGEKGKGKEIGILHYAWERIAWGRMDGLGGCEVVARWL
jgi:hypothetical protein